MHGTALLGYLILILVAARVGGEIACRFKQPAVLGELVAGILLGLLPFIRPAVSSETVLFIAEIGVILLLFEVGLDSELGEFLKVGKPAMLVAIIGVCFPLALCYAVMKALSYPTSIALFLGGTLTATSVGITARVFSDLRRMQSNEAKIVIGAAVVDDILGLLVLAVVGAMAGTAAGESARNPIFTIALAIGFLVVAVIAGLKFAPFFLGVAKRMQGRGVVAVSAFIFGLVVAYLGTLVGLAAIVGAFAAGLILASTEHRYHITERIQPVADIFAPVFFTVVGMQVDLRYLNPSHPGAWKVLGLALLFFAIAVPTKLAAGLGAVKKGVNKLTVGIAMIPRGEVGLIFANVGFHARPQVLTPELYSAMVIAIMLTTLITPPWLKAQIFRSRRRNSAVHDEEAVVESVT